MKHILHIVIISLMVVFTGCSSTGQTGEERASRFGSTVEVDKSGTTLDIYLSRLSGVSVRGTGSGATVRISGYDASSVDSRPLFVIDGSRVGRDFSQVYSMVNMADVDNIRVLRSPRATVLYGEEGGAGAILITFKNRD
jgi:hypothetical protein